MSQQKSFARAEQLNNLGIQSGSFGKIDKAIEYFIQAIKTYPKYADAYSNLGTAYEKLNQPKKSLIHYKRALEINPQLPNIHFHLGIVYNKLGKRDKSIIEYELQLNDNPNHIDTLNNLANIMIYQENRKQAKIYLEKALNIDSSHKKVLYNYVWLLQWICDWEKFIRYSKILDKLTLTELEQGLKTTDQPLFNISRHEDSELNYKVAKSWSDNIQKNIKPNKSFKFDKKSPKDIIRVGYLSNDFHNHATAHLILQMFKLHDRKKFKVFTYSYGPKDDSQFQKEIKQNSDKFTDLQRLDNYQAASIINNDKIDILIDLKGHTKDNRLEICAYKPAPIQITWLGFPGSTGATYFDYIIVDNIVVTPKEAKKYYCEKPIYLPFCYQITNNKQTIDKTTYTRKDFNLPEDSFVFASFCQTYKITPKIYDSWMKIMKAIPKSILWLYVRDESSISNLRTEAEKRGIDSKRIFFTKNLPKSKHLARLKLCDLMLDTPIYNGHTTTSDALWAGIPVITIKGNHFASRVATSILNSIGMSKLVAKDYSEYEKIAITYASNSEKLTDLKTEISKNKKTYNLFNTELFVSNLEKAFLAIWERYAKGNKTDSIIID